VLDISGQTRRLGLICLKKEILAVFSASIVGLAEAGMVLKIVQVGEPVLRREARSLTVDELAGDDIQRLILDMRDTMRDAPGVGLAAPQIGMPLKIAVVEDREEYLRDVAPELLAERDRKPVPFHVLINPRIVHSSEQTVEFPEGCLSLAGFSAIVPRAAQIQVECINEKGQPRTLEASGWYARILQHEIDHLRGNIYIDRMDARTFSTLANWNKYGAKTKSINR
jgi:peptide deformylase